MILTNSYILQKILTKTQIKVIYDVFCTNYYNRTFDEKIFIYITKIIMGLALLHFMGNGIFSLGTSQSLSKAAVSSGADY